MIIYENHIILDKIDSWPSRVLDVVKANEDSLKGFLLEEHRIDELSREDLTIRYYRPKNLYFEIWDNTIQEIDEILKKYSIIGFHCTKLLEPEIRDIQLNGLRPLNKDFAYQRIESAFEQGLISERLRNELKSKEELDADNRKGKIFVFHCLTTLKDEWGLNRLLGYWGGESLYGYIKNPQELKNIGIPCIALTSIEIKNLDIYPELSKRMIAYYFDDNYYPHDTDSIFETNLNVLRIIKRDEQLFEDLTNIQNWKDEI
jgi:hypothetical protein